MSPQSPIMPTIGEIARRLQVPVHRVEYIIRARDVRPCGWAGNARVFPEQAVETIASALRQIDGGRIAQDEQALVGQECSDA